MPSLRAITFPYDPAKGAQAIMWLLKRHKGHLSKLSLIKLLYLADKEHLSKYGRPIVGGQYYALPHGPVSSELLNHVDSAKSKGSYPFFQENNQICADTDCDCDELSQSDIEILNKIDHEHGSWTASRLRGFTHSLKEWASNWSQKKDGTQRHPISYEDLFCGEKDEAMLEVVRDEQEAWADFD